MGLTQAVPEHLADQQGAEDDEPGQVEPLADGAGDAAAVQGQDRDQVEEGDEEAEVGEREGEAPPPR